MYNIAIVEDEWECFQNLKECLEKYTEEYGVAFKIDRFSNGIDFISDYRANFDIVFMDVDMPGMNGFATAKKLREMDSSVVLIFVTFLAKYAIKGYEVSAMDYVVKPVNYAAFKMKIERAIDVCRKNRGQETVLKIREGVARIPLKDLIYVEIAGHDIVYHTTHGDYSAYGTLKAVESALPASMFAQCHSCYLVNLSHVSKIEDNSVFLGNIELAISRPRKKPFLRALYDYSMGGGV